MSSGLILLLIVTPLGGLGALLWWRFRGAGKPSKLAGAATRNHWSLRHFHYGPSGATAAAPPATWFHLLPEEDFQAAQVQSSPARTQPDGAGEATAMEAGAQATPPDAGTSAAAPFHPPAPAPPAAAGEEGTTAAALFHNPLTAAAPTRNDEANRRVAVELRQRQRAALQASSAGPHTALTGLLAATAVPP